MRLLVRSNAHRQLEAGGAELASSPDTVGRERWRWDLRVGDSSNERDQDAEQQTIHLPGDRGSSLTLTFDPVQVSARLEPLDGSQVARLDRSMAELLIIVAGDGGLLVEGRHRLNDLDVMVLEGDDPVTVAVESTTAAAANAALARISYVDGTRIAWVP